MIDVETTFPVAVERPVRWGDMDAFQHVNNTVYFRWFECARIAYFQRVGFDGGESVGPILAHTECRFRRPVAFPDTVVIRAGVVALGDDRFTMAYRGGGRRGGGAGRGGHGPRRRVRLRSGGQGPAPARRPHRAPISGRARRVLI